MKRYSSNSMEFKFKRETLATTSSGPRRAEPGAGHGPSAVRAALALLLLGLQACGGVEPLAELSVGEQARTLAPLSVLEMDLPGCEDLSDGWVASVDADFRVQRHPIDPELAVVALGGEYVCIGIPPASFASTMIPPSGDSSVKASFCDEEDSSGGQNQKGAWVADDPIPIMNDFKKSGSEGSANKDK